MFEEAYRAGWEAGLEKCAIPNPLRPWRRIAKKKSFATELKEELLKTLGGAAVGAAVGAPTGYLLDKKFRGKLTKKERARREEANIQNPLIGGALVGAVTGALAKKML